MADATDPDELIRDNLAENVKRTAVEGLDVTTHSLPDQIAAAKYLAEQKVAANPFSAMRRAKLKAPGTVGDCE